MDRRALPQARKPLRLRDWGPTNEPLRAERIEADYATPITYPTTGGAVLSTRDSVTLGFGLEQLSQAQRNEVVKRAMTHLLPTTPDTTPPTISGFKYAGTDPTKPNGPVTATTNDPVELELTTFDERGDMDKVELYADGALYATTEVYPFQFRYTAPASAVGKTVQLTAKAFDAAGNTATSATLFVNVVSAAGAVESPLPIAAPTLAGSPVVGQTLTCVSGGFLNGPESFSYQWLRNGTVIAGATGGSYVPSTGDVGRSIACRLSATNGAGTGDATSEALVVSPAAPTPQPATPTPTPTPKPAVKFTAKAACKMASSRKAITCTITRLTPKGTKTTLSGTARVQNTKKTYRKSSKTDTVKITVRSTKRLKKGAKVVISVKSGSTTKHYTVKSK